jgi:prepilin-type N-terminal cleavage/methylation domain-containing protein
MKRKRSASHREGQQGFNFFEIMIVVAIIGIVSSIVLANFLQARQTSQEVICASQLEQIASAKVQAAFSAGLGDNDTPTDEQIAQFLDNVVGSFDVIDGSDRICPAGGVYNVNPLNTLPTCSLAGGPGEHRVE